MTFLRLSKAASHGPAAPAPLKVLRRALARHFWLCQMAGNLLQRLNESVTLKWTTGLFMCTSSSSATVAVAVALFPAHSTEHTARSSRRSLMRRNGRNRKKCSMLLSELGAVFEPRYLCALIYHLSRVPHTLDTLQNRWSLYIYTRTHLCVCRCACAIASQIEFPQLNQS